MRAHTVGKPSRALPERRTYWMSYARRQVLPETETQMLFIVKGNSDKQDQVLRIHASDAAQAEAIGWKHGVFVTEVTPLPASNAGVTRLDRVADMVWRAWRHRPA